MEKFLYDINGKVTEESLITIMTPLYKGFGQLDYNILANYEINLPRNQEQKEAMNREKLNNLIYMDRQTRSQIPTLITMDKQNFK